MCQVMKKLIKVFVLLLALTSCSQVSTTTENIVNECPNLIAESIEKAYLNQWSDIVFVSRNGVNTFNLETNEWSCKKLNDKEMLTVKGAEAAKSFQAAVQLSLGEPNLQIRKITPVRGNDIVDAADALCDALNFPIRFSPSTKQDILGCQISSLAKTAIMFAYDKSNGNIQIAFSAIYEPFVTAVIKG